MQTIGKAAKRLRQQRAERQAMRSVLSRDSARLLRDVGLEAGEPLPLAVLSRPGATATPHPLAQEENGATEHRALADKQRDARILPFPTIALLPPQDRRRAG
ncbi:hypothetical protein KYK29_02095 [Shinella daejeonensis]|uniref:hypothetical protein n=1 Tax=Shinella daejeonensis TaxID=659017 RepID=UPI0020C7DEF5|nr:hypothetical protein [Shinella daejeonensis]MCP8893705.1 hypothetical protein [Shinella daejeonensis]